MTEITAFVTQTLKLHKDCARHINTIGVSRFVYTVDPAT
jgi:hypothetical protein